MDLHLKNLDNDLVSKNKEQDELNKAYDGVLNNSENTVSEADNNKGLEYSICGNEGNMPTNQDTDKIAFIAESFSENNLASGGIIVNIELLKKLANLGYEIDIYSKKYSNVDNLFKNYYKISEFEKFQKNYQLILSEKGLSKSDITYIHDFSFILRLDKTCNNIFSKFLQKLLHKKKLKEYFRIKNALNDISKIIVSSNLLKEDFIKNYSVPIEKLYILPPPIQEVTKVEYRPKAQTTVFGVAANGFVNKGGFILLEALKRLKKENKKFKVKIIYEKAQKNLWLKIKLNFYGLKDYIEFLPTQKDMNNFYNSIDYCIVPSYAETFSMVASEAMAHYKPVIVSSNCGVIDYVKNNKNGFIVDYSKNKEKNLAKSLKEAINKSEKEYELLAHNAFNSVQELNLENFVSKYIEIMNEEKKNKNV